MSDTGERGELLVYFLFINECGLGLRYKCLLTLLSPWSVIGNDECYKHNSTSPLRNPKP